MSMRGCISVSMIVGAFVVGFAHQADAAVQCNANRVNNQIVTIGQGQNAVAIDRDHIFCGEVSNNRAKGFHARPGGEDPVTVNTDDAQEVVDAIIVDHALVGTGLYTLYNFDITQNNVTKEKSRSTMFPDTCSYQAVLDAIANAYRDAIQNNNWNGNAFEGPSGTHCQTNQNKSFQIQGYTLNPINQGYGHVRTAHPTGLALE